MYLSEPPWHPNTLSISATFPWQHRMPAINTTSQKHDNRSWIKYTNVFCGSRQPAIHDWSLSEHNVCMKVVSKKLVDFWKCLLTVCLQFHFYHFYNSPKIVSFTFKQKIILHQITNKQKNHPVNSTIKNEDFFFMPWCLMPWIMIFICPCWCAPEEANIPWIKVDIYLLGSVRVSFTCHFKCIWIPISHALMQTHTCFF